MLLTMILSGGSRVKRAPIVRRNRWPMVVIIIAAVLLALVAGFFAWKYFDSDEDPQSAASQRVIEKVGKLYLTPQGEEPTVAQIQDKEKLKEQHFFDNAANGDYLLIFGNSQFALIYREDVNKIVNVGPISTDQGQVGGASTDVPQESP